MDQAISALSEVQVQIRLSPLLTEFQPKFEWELDKEALAWATNITTWRCRTNLILSQCLASLTTRVMYASIQAIRGKSCQLASSSNKRNVNYTKWACSWGQRWGLIAPKLPLVTGHVALCLATMCDGLGNRTGCLSYDRNRKQWKKTWITENIHHVSCRTQMRQNQHFLNHLKLCFLKISL